MHNSFNVLWKLKQLSQFYSSLAVLIPVEKKNAFPCFPASRNRIKSSSADLHWHCDYWISGKYAIAVGNCAIGMI